MLQSAPRLLAVMTMAQPLQVLHRVLATIPTWYDMVHVSGRLLASIHLADRIVSQYHQPQSLPSPTVSPIGCRWPGVHWPPLPRVLSAIEGRAAWVRAGFRRAAWHSLGILCYIEPLRSGSLWLP